MSPNVDSVLSDSLTVRWDAVLESLIIQHMDDSTGDGPEIRIRSETLREMNFSQATSFIGERIALLMPALRTRYINPKTGMVDMSS